MLGYADRSRLLDDVARPYVFDSVNNSAPVVLLDGRIVAVWDVAPGGGRGTDPTPAVSVFPVAPIPARAAERIGPSLARVLGDTGADRWRSVAGMVSLLDRPVGAFAHPLR
jgi:hypothetical protein